MGKQIVISSDRSPKDLRMMDERLRSRFESGLIADVAPPEMETRLAILHRKAEVERARIPDDVLLYMAKLVQSNIRTLEGALVKIIACASLQNSPVTCELAASVLERYYQVAGDAGMKPDLYGDLNSFGGWGRNTPERPAAPSPRTGAGLSGVYSGNTDGANGRGSSGRMGSMGRSGITADLVRRVVGRKFGLDADALDGKRRDKETVFARQIAMHLTRELTEMSLPGIGQLFGGRDHSTVAYACDRVRSQLPFDDDLRSLVEDLVTQLQAQAMR
jgi:chromosomal replication initiation ATPase DnaA